MEIFIGNLPLNASVVDLRKLFGKIDSGTRLRICRLKMRDGSSICYGHAVIDSEQAGYDLILNFNGSLMQDKYIEVREFEQRKVANDRRAPLWTGAPWSGLNRRQSERRRMR